ncbi:glycosyl hydrolase [Roseivirga sp.]|uniref:glycosyl hydrolase n=1 Tax=Roseivirga sp. TaxID=1964215 RepID=UPI003B8C086A
MLRSTRLFRAALIFLIIIFNTGETLLIAQTTQVGSASYTTVFPGVDEAGRNGVPPGTPQLSGNALGKPVPTNDWWSALINNDHTDNLFNYPMALKTTNAGLVVSYIPWGVYDDQEPIIVGVTDLNASRANVSDYSDWTVTMDFNDGSHQLEATSGIAMPFLYFNKASEDEARVTVNLGEVTVKDEVIIVRDARNGGDFAIYAPSGSTWMQDGNTYTSDLNGKDFWSMAMIPLNAEDIDAVVEEYKVYAYVFPANTTTSWDYNNSTGVVRTDFTIDTDVKEGEGTNMLIGLLPHQWDNLASNSAQPDKYSYSSVRGELKTMAGNSFSVENTFYGILPTMPYLANYSEGFSPAEMNDRIKEIENEGLATWTDSYNEGQVMNRLIQTARIADQTGNTEALDKIVATIKERLEDWLTYEASEVAFLFYYNSDWSAMLGYPAGHGQDNNINDHHFHWGYFIHAAAFMEQFEPGWADKWGEMINHLVRDAASSNRNDDLFPFLRNFSPYAGHCWANGFASFPQGNDQESTSESMQFNSSLIHWGSITGNDEIRDLGIYLYTTEQTAIEEYWLDMNERTFKDDQQYSLVSRVWGNSYDNGTFWTSDITASYVIEMYPIHGGSLYLGQNQDYVQKIWNELKQYTGILDNNDNNPNLWHDVIWKYLSFIDPEEAIELYDANQERTLKFGVSDAQTYHWLHAINALGTVDISVTADHPIASAFNKDGETTYVAHNYSNTPITVTYSDGYALEVPAKTMATSRDINAKGSLVSDFDRAYAEGSINLTASIEGEGITKVEFLDGNTVIGEKTAAPFEIRATDLSLGIHGFYARVYIDEDFVVSNIVSVQVGEQVPYSGTASALPGSIEAGHYDKYEGGSGQGVSYVDVSAGNEGNFRTDESMDATNSGAEGATIGWIASGEWVEYTINVTEPGIYDMDFRYASNNQNGGGPFHLELDGKVISDDISVPFTGGWETWETKSVADLNFAGGSHVLRVVFDNGEFNLGKMTFSFADALPYSQPVAHAGKNVLVVLPKTTAALDGSGSNDPDASDLTYNWTQVFGPSSMEFSDPTIVNPEISGLVEGVYLVNLSVSNSEYNDDDDVYVIVDEDGSFAPLVGIISPEDGQEFIEGKTVDISASASDIDDNISQIEFFVDGNSIAVVTSTPYTTSWTAVLGDYVLTATATDEAGNTTTSDEVEITVIKAPSCSGESVNGEYSYEFSNDAENPTLTFIPSETGVGDQTCILYYRTDSSSEYGGYNVTPNIPFQLNAAEGSTVSFYYTYSFPGQGEKTTADSPQTYVVGTCIPEEIIILTMEDATMSINENSEVGTLVGTPESEYSGTGTLSYSITSGNGSGAFQISNTSGSISVADSDLMDFETTPTFTIGLSVTDGELTATATITINLNDEEEIVTGLKEAITNRLEIYPNPVSTTLTLNVPSGELINLYGIVNAQGKELNVPVQTEENKMILDFSGLSNGIYLLLIEKLGVRYYMKVLKR